ncbi:MAG: two-component regulator propeller domain-containing protein [Bacteroidia bacterium]
MKKIYHLFLLLIFVSSGNGQNKTHLPKDSTDNYQDKPKTVTSGQPKMIKTQGTGYSQIGCGLMDKAGNLWFGTLGEGVYRYDARLNDSVGQGKSFINFTKKDGLSNNNVNVIIEDKAGNILFGTDSGICRYNGKSFTSFTVNNDASKKHIISLLEDSEGNLWFGTMNSGVYRYDVRLNDEVGQGKTFTEFLNEFIIDILQDKTGSLWFCSWERGGVGRYDPSAPLKEGGKSVTNYKPSTNYYLPPKDNPGNYLKPYTPNLPQDSITDDMIFSVSEDQAGNLWFATRRHGACRYDGKSFTNFTENNGFLDKGMYSILEDKNGNLWFTTEKDGIWRYDPSASLRAGGKSFKNFTTKDGLINDSVFIIIEDKSGNLWFGTRDFGLSCYNGKSFTDFTEKDSDK